MPLSDAQREAQIDLFEAAKVSDVAACQIAVDKGADINFQYRGGAVMACQGWRLRMGGVEWGLQEWDAPEGVIPEGGDTLLMIAIKCRLAPVVAWIQQLDQLRKTQKNNAGKTAEDVAREYGEEQLIDNDDLGALPASPVSRSKVGVMESPSGAPVLQTSMSQSGRYVDLRNQEEQTFHVSGPYSAWSPTKRGSTDSASTAAGSLCDQPQSPSMTDENAVLRREVYKLRDTVSMLSKQQLKSEKMINDLSNRLKAVEASQMPLAKPNWMT
ncbi:unnamed protein product [Chrysoparadoxa australica]